MNIAEDGKITLYGIYDTKDNVWLGDDFGPKRFDDFTIARIAAQVTEDQVFGSDLGGRYVAKPIPDAERHLRDEVTTKRTPLQSLRRIENSGADPVGPDIVIEFDGAEWLPPV
jgi:hypothetical protein